MSEHGQPPLPQALVIFDAGPIVGFAAAGRLTLLVEVFDRIRMQRAVPFAVDKEVRRQGRKYAAVSRRWPAAVMSGRFEVLDEVAVGVADQRVVAEAARLRDTDPDSALSAQRDLGEILTVAHAVVARSDGLQVAVSTDDSYGARLAGAEQLLNLDTVAILRLAIRLGLIAAKTDLQTLYRALSLYSHLPPLTATRLLEEKFGH
jgi:predicted nucleic acid-binding protein